MIDHTSKAAEIAAAVVSGKASAAETVEMALKRIDATNPHLNAFTTVTAERARKRATALDAAKAKGQVLGPLAGVPLASKTCSISRGFQRSPVPRSTAICRRQVPMPH
jgi:aspartyl-tRNA(Asn)/glutamyl-tRNA(Gln) amidotransferase subunit A